MFELLKEKLKNLKHRIQNKQSQEDNSYIIAPAFEDEDEDFELTTSQCDNIYKLEISDYIKITSYIKAFKENDPYNLYDAVSNNILWNGGKQRVNKGTYYVIYEGNRLYNILASDGTIEIDERTTYENGYTDEKILSYDSKEKTYKYAILKHDETGSTYLTKFYNKKGLSEEFSFFRYPYEESYKDITDLIANLQTIPNIDRVIDINILLEQVVRDMEINPIIYKKTQ